MLGSRDRLVGIGCLALVVAVSCAVFPDQATLPAPTPGAAGVATSGGDGEPSSSAGAVGASAAGQSTMGGMTASGGVPNGGAPAFTGGAGADALGAGAGGEPSICNDPYQAVVPMDFDTWIEAAKPKQSHGNDAKLLVVGGPDERRALLQLVLPANLDGALPSSALLTLHLRANADVGASARRLGLHRLNREVGSNTTWDNYDNGGSNKWDKSGGDFGPELARARVPGGTTEASVAFDVTELIRSSQTSTAVTLSVVILEIGSAPPAPADLAFDAAEGDASVSPKLTLNYCAP